MRLPEEVLRSTTGLEPDLHPSIARPEPSPVRENLLKGFAGKVVKEALEKTARRHAADIRSVARCLASDVVLIDLKDSLPFAQEISRRLGMTLHLRRRDEYPFSLHQSFLITGTGLALAFRVRQPAALSFNIYVELIVRTYPMHLAGLDWQYSTTLSYEPKGPPSTPLQTGPPVPPTNSSLCVHIGAYYSPTLGAEI